MNASNATTTKAGQSGQRAADTVQNITRGAYQLRAHFRHELALNRPDLYRHRNGQWELLTTTVSVEQAMAKGFTSEEHASLIPTKAKEIDIVWRDRNGNEYRESGTREEHLAQLAKLDAIENYTALCAPTDSGGVRFNYNAEADAIRTALGLVQLLECSHEINVPIEIANAALMAVGGHAVLPGQVRVNVSPACISEARALLRQAEVPPKPRVTLREIVAIHVLGSGPVSFGSILSYCDAQMPGFRSERDSHLAATELTHLIRAGIVDLYDDGSFNSGSVRWNVLNEPEPVVPTVALSLDEVDVIDEALDEWIDSLPAWQKIDPQADIDSLRAFGRAASGKVNALRERLLSFDAAQKGGSR